MKKPLKRELERQVSQLRILRREAWDQLHELWDDRRRRDSYWMERSRVMALVLSQLGYAIPLENPPDRSMHMLAEALDVLHE